MSNGDVDAVELLDGVISVVGCLLVNDGVDGNGSLSSLSVSNDELSLSSADGHEGVDGLQTGLHGLVDGLSGDDSGGLELDSLSSVGLDGAETIDGDTEGVDDSAEHALSDGHIDDGPGSLDDITLLDLSVVTQDDDTYVVRLEVESHTLDSGAELNHFSSLHLHEAENSRDTVSNRDNSSELFQVILEKHIKSVLQRRTGCMSRNWNS